MSKVTAHYDEAYRAVKAEMAKIVAIQARGGTNLTVDMNSTTQDWIDLVINPETRTAPEGGVAGYAGTADDATGVVGIDVSDPIITITRPAYLELQGDNVTIDMTEM